MKFPCGALPYHEIIMEAATTDKGALLSAQGGMVPTCGLRLLLLALRSRG